MNEIIELACEVDYSFIMCTINTKVAALENALAAEKATIKEVFITYDVVVVSNIFIHFPKLSYRKGEVLHYYGVDYYVSYRACDVHLLHEKINQSKKSRKLENIKGLSAGIRYLRSYKR